jgi:hypothetical protein
MVSKDRRVGIERCQSRIEAEPTRPSEKAASAFFIVEISWFPVQQIANAFLTLLEFLAAAARAWIAFISVRETLMVSSDQNL